MKDHILIVEDEVDLLNGLKRLISFEIDCRVFTAANAMDGLRILKDNHIDLLLTDIRMPDMDGVKLLDETHKIDPAVTVVMMTAYGSIETAVQTIKKGAYDFIQKPFVEKRLIHLLKKGLELNRLVRENLRLTEKIQKTQTPFKGMVGKSPAMQNVFRTIKILSQSDITVLLLGESGTGKEMAAQAIHELSTRHQHDLVPVNCPTLPENILESELFGYKKGAFTNAYTDKTGLFEIADGGTIFLDEIGDLSPVLQTKLLRVLQEKEIKPLGDTVSRPVDVRIIASTNRNLEDKIVDGTFREDLYYRLNVASLTLPPLRDRMADIPYLVDFFLSKTAGELKLTEKKISTEALNKLLTLQWPGNVRELENTISRLTAMVVGEVIRVGDIIIDDTDGSGAMPRIDSEEPYKQAKEYILQNFSSRYFNNLFKKTNGNIALAARKSGLKRQSLQKIIKRYHLRPDKFR